MCVARRFKHVFQQTHVGWLVVHDEDVGVKNVLGGKGHGVASLLWVVTVLAPEKASAASSAPSNCCTLKGLVT